MVLYSTFFQFCSLCIEYLICLLQPSSYVLIYNFPILSHKVTFFLLSIKPFWSSLHTVAVDPCQLSVSYMWWSFFFMRLRFNLPVRSEIVFWICFAFTLTPIWFNPQWCHKVRLRLEQLIRWRLLLHLRSAALLTVGESLQIRSLQCEVAYADEQC